MGRFVCCCFYWFWWPYFVSFCFNSFLAFLALLFCDVFLFWPSMDDSWLLFLLVTEFLLCLSVFFDILICLFWVCCFRTIDMRVKYRRPGARKHSYAFFMCPPAHHIDVFRPSAPFIGTYAPLALCVCLLLVRMCTFGHVHIFRSRACVCAGAYGAWMCVLGVLCVSRDP